jgi:hypothetical protein
MIRGRGREEEKEAKTRKKKGRACEERDWDTNQLTS